ncbi:hypothetical protein FZX09_04025 [Synechococcus sp. MU1643]|uniref:MADF domain-containing protein n=1 Tax=Synechococcus sp. MU1643 TaxID=2508349 RepID=UPI001CF89C1A|nr:MADF domain-containing protein [Synechococcus sp. MU1643]MCB4427980.1 hypothetical protein [Synechococcus sp. MU1643]
MAELFLVTLSEAPGNDINGQKWMLGRMCNRVEYMGKATLTTMNSTWSDLSTLVNTLCRLYAATGQNFWVVNDFLQEKLTEVESQYPPEQIKGAQLQWESRRDQFRKEFWRLQCDREDELMQRKLRYFWMPTR